MTTHIPVIDPRTDAPIDEIPAGDESAARDAVTVAARAARAWSHRPQRERSALVARAGAALLENLDELAEIESRESGRPLSEAREGIEASVANFAHFATVAGDGYDVQPLADGGAVRRRPLGVVALIVPWNFPLLIAFRFLPGMIVVGNTVVWKPSEKTPLSAVRAHQIIASVLPEGVVELLLGDARAGRPLVDDGRVSLVALTGSTATGIEVAAVSARHLRPVMLELGGKDAVIIDDGVDAVEAARVVAEGAFSNTGQICTSMERVYVHQAIADEFTRALVREAENSWRMDRDGGRMGPLIDQGQRDRVAAHVADAQAQGATILTGGAIPAGPGSYFPATVLTGATGAMSLMRDETFGPVAPIQVVRDFDEALELASDSAYGLALTVFTHDPAHVEATRHLDVGTVWVNGWHRYADGALHQPGGQSGSGAVGWRGREFLDAVTAPQFLSTPEN